MPDDIIQVSCFIIYMDKVMIYDKQNISTKNGYQLVSVVCKTQSLLADSNDSRNSKLKFFN